MKKNKYIVRKVNYDLGDLANDSLWDSIDKLKISNYVWADNNYKPEVDIQVLYSNNILYLKYFVKEEKITIRYTNINDPVYKDSCVEFFINLFPDATEKYFNLEVNALGVIKLGYGIKRERFYLRECEIKKIKVLSSINEPVVGYHGSNHWVLYIAIPLKLLEEYSSQVFVGNNAIGNFYKCGDETEFKHYGVWNIIDNPKPDFHLPEFFGQIIFEK